MTDKNNKPVVNFVVLQSVEDYVEKSGKFRTECSFFRIPGRDSGGANTLYIPYCEKQRFDFGPVLNDFRGHGVFTPPEVGKPWEIPDFVVFREHFHDIHCPQPCRGYSDKRVVVENEKPTPQVYKGVAVDSTVDGKWTRKDTIILVATAVVALLCAFLGWVTPEGRRLLHLDNPQAESQISVPSASTIDHQPDSVPPPKPDLKPGPTKPPNVPTENHTVSHKATAVVKPSSVVDWRDKHNWRKYLHTGLTRREVRLIFGDPEKMRVFSDIETWEYGSGSISFVVENATPDGSLYSWDEPD